MDEWKKQKRKRARLSGDAYETSKGKNIKKKELKPYDHRCRYGCDKISEEQRMNLFTKFYEIQTYDLQTQYLASCISKTNVKRHNSQAVSHKNFATVLRLMNFRVCKEYFLRTFDITNRRLRIVCQKKIF